ncbi:hypothetical protein, partial [Aeromonas dhakensis]|uniref:hypothetical protein n=1 Tax=Aeromonas dhakensis TaxID=196024 RepID=UPI002B488C32
MHRIHTAGDQLASSRHRGGELLQLRDRSPGQQQERPNHPDHDLSWYRGHRHCRGPARAHRFPMAIEHQGNQVHRIHTA